MQTAKLSELIACSLIDARVSVCTHVPGYGGTETFQAYQKLRGERAPFSFHEEVAYSISHAAGLTGARSACLIKTHGFAKAANSVVSSLSAGTRGGVVVFAFNDEEGGHSDNIFAAEELIRGSEIPNERLKLGDPFDQIHRAYSKSEALGLPVALIVNTSQIHQEVGFERKEIPWNPVFFRSQPEFNVVCPPMARFQRRVFEAKISGRTDWPTMEEAPTLEVPGGLPPFLREAARSYEPIFDVFKKVVRGSSDRSVLVSGDAGTSSLFAFEPFRCIDFCTYMGGSIALAIGSSLARNEKSWAVTGDFSFLAAGCLGLLEAMHRDVGIKVLIFDNQRAAATGNQMIAPGLLESVLKPYAECVSVVDAQDSAERISDVLKIAHQSQSMSIVVAKSR